MKVSHPAANGELLSAGNHHTVCLLSNLCQVSSWEEISGITGESAELL